MNTLPTNERIGLQLDELHHREIREDIEARRLAKEIRKATKTQAAAVPNHWLKRLSTFFRVSKSMPAPQKAVRTIG
jgi:hypothetical protein